MKENKVLSLLEIKRTFAVGRTTLFDALTRPEIMSEWFYGMDEGRAEVDSDFRVGGKYEIRMFKADGSEAGCADYAPHGEYLEIEAPSRVVFTWISEGFVDHSVVTIVLEERDGATELTLRHELPEAVIPDHRQGWETCLGHLAAKRGG